MKKQLLSFWQMVNLNFGFAGIQFGWGLQMANMSGIYKFLGADTSNLAILWLAAPVTGILVQPILGQLSDQTWIKWLGRRRPYILVGAIIATVALIVMPNANSIWLAAMMLWLLDGSVNTAMQPYRALVADVAPTEQHTKVYAIQSCLVGIGATFATALPWIFIHVFNLPFDAQPGTIPLAIKLSFYIGAVVFLGANLWTTLKSKEYPPEDLAAWREEKKNTATANPAAFIKHIIVSFIKMPIIMRQISFVQFFTWAGWFCLNTYFALGVAQNLFGLPVDANVSSSSQYGALLENGVVFAGLLFSTYTLVSFVYAYFIPHVSRLMTRKVAHVVALTLGGLGLIAASFMHSKLGFFFCMIGIGIAWASIITIPYAMLAGSLPENKMGLYMGLFNITVTLPQIIASSLLGFVVAYVFQNHAMGAVAFGGALYIIGAIFTFFVQDKKIEEII